MIKIYGIKNCDIMQKAFKWLDANDVAYEFHNYREDGLDKTIIERWLKHLPVDKVINSRSTTFRELPEADRASIKDKAAAIALIIANPSIIKRPLWDFGNGDFFLGWDEKEISRRI